VATRRFDMPLCGAWAKRPVEAAPLFGSFGA
jgi:hypothetical protein